MIDPHTSSKGLEALYGQVRALEETPVESLSCVELDAVIDGLGALSGPRADLDPERVCALDARLEHVCHALFADLLSKRGWAHQGGGVYMLEPYEGTTLVGLVSGYGFGATCAPEWWSKTPRYMDILGTAHGCAQLELMLECVEHEFTHWKKTSTIELTEAQIASELARRRAYLESIECEALEEGVSQAMYKVCDESDWLEWAQRVGCSEPRAVGGEVNCFTDYEGSQRVYTPALSIHGGFTDDCSEIWVATRTRFETRDEALEWARERLGRSERYLSLSPEWRHLCSGKRYAEMSSYY